MSLGFIFGPSRSEPPEERVTVIFCAVVGLLFLALCAGLAIDTLRGQVRADEQGLRWREGLSGWKRARWDEISDFYRLGRQSGTPVLETPRGKLWLSDRFSGIGAIVDLVPQRAATSRAREWEVRNYRRGEDWEQTLAVWTKSQVWLAPLFTLGAIYVIGFLGYAIIAGPRNIAAPLDFRWFDAAGLIIAFLLLISLCAVIIVPTVLAWRERKFAWAHRDETLAMNARGIAFASNDKRVEAAWSEVQLVAPRAKERGVAGYRVITKNGEFTIWSLSSDQMFARFRTRCESYAPNALKPLQVQAEALSFDAEINPSPARADGAQIFSFRTRGNRLLVGTISALLFLAPLLYLIIVYNHAFEEPFTPSWLLFGALCALAIVVSSALYLYFSRAYIVATANELQLHSPFSSPRHVNWDCIEAAGADAWGSWIFADERKIYWARGMFPVRRAELEARIERAEK